MPFKTSILLFSTFFLLFQTGCSSKSPAPSECGSGTMVQSVGLGVTVGVIASNLVQSNMFVGALIGGLAGAAGGKQLLTLQCQYYGDEKLLLEQISHNIASQNSLVIKTKQLNKKMHSLYEEITQLKSNKYFQLNRRNELEQRINRKQNEVLNIQTLNHQVMGTSHAYYDAVSNSNFSQKDKESIHRSLKNIFHSLNSIEEASLYNLKQLNNFKRKLRK